jgi:hypothetical protein
MAGAGVLQKLEYLILNQLAQGYSLFAAVMR